MSELDSHLDRLIRESLDRKHPYHLSSDYGWWTGKLRNGEQLFVATYSEETWLGEPTIFVARFSAGGDLFDVTRQSSNEIANLFDDSCSSSYKPGSLESILQETWGSVSGGTIFVKPFKIPEISVSFEPYAWQELEFLSDPGSYSEDEKETLLAVISDHYSTLDFGNHYHIDGTGECVSS